MKILKLLTWIPFLRRNRLKEHQAALGARVEIVANYTCKGQVGTIIDHEHTVYPTVELDGCSPMRFLIDELKLIDDSRITIRPVPAIAIEQLLEFADFCTSHFAVRFFLVSSLTLRHLLNEPMRFGSTWYTTPTLVDVGNCPVLTELVVKGIPVIDKLPVHIVAKDVSEIPHFIAGIGYENGVYYLTSLLNPEIAQIPRNKKGNFDTRKISNTKMKSEFNNLALGRKAKARWNF